MISYILVEFDLLKSTKIRAKTGWWKNCDHKYGVGGYINFNESGHIIDDKENIFLNGIYKGKIIKINFHSLLILMPNVDTVRYCAK